MTSFRILSSFECFLRSFQKEWSVFLPFSVNCSQVAMSQIMPTLCPHGQGEGGGWSAKCGQAWTGGWGVPKITKFVRKSFMHEPLVVGGGGKIMTAWIQASQLVQISYLQRFFKPLKDEVSSYLSDIYNFSFSKCIPISPENCQSPSCEYVKLRALRPQVPHVPQIILCPTYSCTSRVSWPTCSLATYAPCLTCPLPYVLRALRAVVPHVLSSFVHEKIKNQIKNQYLWCYIRYDTIYTTLKMWKTSSEEYKFQ